MNSSDSDGAAGRDAPDSAADIDDRAAVRSRETLAAAREDAVDLRENAVDVREGSATSREREIRVAETTQAASDEHMSMLQQANARRPEDRPLFLNQCPAIGSQSTLVTAVISSGISPRLCASPYRLL